MSPTLDRTRSLGAYPNITTASKLMGISAATISRRRDVEKLPRGERDVVLAPAEVLRLAAIYRKRSLNDVGQDLIENARAVSEEDSLAVEAEVERFFEDRVATDEEYKRFRTLARQLLPGELARRVEAVLDEKAEPLPDYLLGYRQPEP
jgi:hypothetical protein